MGKTPGEGKWQPTPVFLPEKIPLTEPGIYSLWGHKESYTIEQLMHALKMEAIYKPWRRLSPENKFAETLIMDF